MADTLAQGRDVDANALQEPAPPFQVPAHDPAYGPAMVRGGPFGRAWTPNPVFFGGLAHLTQRLAGENRRALPTRTKAKIVRGMLRWAVCAKDRPERRDWRPCGLRCRRSRMGRTSGGERELS